MSDIKLKNVSGTETTYSGVTKIKIPNASGTGNAEYIQPSGSISITGTSAVDVTEKATAQVSDSNLVAENIKKDVSILGVTGTLAGGGGLDYTVTFKTNGDDYTMVSCLSGNSIAAPENPVLAGYHFNGWATTSGASTADVTFPYTPNDDKTLYAVLGAGQGATITGLGSTLPSAVTFNVDANFFSNILVDNFTQSGNVFIKIKKVWRKINTTSSGQITSISLADTKIDSTYEIYPCFVRPDGTEMDYVLMGKYMSTNSSGINSVSGGTKATYTLANARTYARALGTGYQLYDWQFQKLWQDLIIAKMQTVNINSGSGFDLDSLGFSWVNSGGWVDGIARTAGYKWCYATDPTKYVDSPTASTTGYAETSYSAPSTSSVEISALGYDSSAPFVNYPSATVSNSSYDTYYCDGYWSSSSNAPVSSYVGTAAANYGAWYCDTAYSWTSTCGVRLCYRPL